MERIISFNVSITPQSIKMKLFLVALTLAVVFICTDAGNYGAILKSVAGTCKDKEGASDDDVNKISEAKVPETKEGKCLVACLGEQFGIVSFDL